MHTLISPKLCLLGQISVLFTSFQRSSTPFHWSIKLRANAQCIAAQFLWRRMTAGCLGVCMLYDCMSNASRWIVNIRAYMQWMLCNVSMSHISRAQLSLADICFSNGTALTARRRENSVHTTALRNVSLLLWIHYTHYTSRYKMSYAHCWLCTEIPKRAETDKKYNMISFHRRIITSESVSALEHYWSIFVFLFFISFCATWTRGFTSWIVVLIGI